MTVPPAPQMTAARYFTPAQNADLATLLEAIWPGAPPARPGAREAGASDYVDCLLAMPQAYYEVPGWRATYQAGLAMLTGAAKVRYPGLANLAALTPDQATDLLSQLQAGALAGFPDMAWQKNFFMVMRSHAIEGCLADPRWGGNRNGAVWNWLGYPGAPPQRQPF
ncbi:gluconate 2-dehydrogenase subunit 3 family protein [Mesorhizobium sp. CO1-1-7]|uniref:gluconate 2-dehydrogenase subunit 3 family protein n=1 Tax=Mesorhizobium sp. CO1-1-7 TaxID=2876632 RepID=UPI001CD15DBA|nr:gluconate 2-dehydrogenase subunit 3 family protein [Mesorhizobium sp. CO1-1-7]MBZ9744306.1 gluconate 2-dehydrogenase subunit 3 family protein [Mesorhizobium sp. CO1-1-7]